MEIKTKKDFINWIKRNPENEFVLRLKKFKDNKTLFILTLSELYKSLRFKKGSYSMPFIDYIITIV